MKTGIKILIILMGLIVGGCEYGISPEIPAPLSPDGEDYVISDGKMRFSWEAVEGAQKYAIEIAEDRRFDEQVYFYTVYGVTEHGVLLEYFEPFEDYYWRVAAYLEADLAEWSKPVKFTYIPLIADLDTTYFPFGPGYEWCYERRHLGHDTRGEPEWWDEYDTFTNIVTDSFWIGDTLCFQINGSIVKIWDNKVYCDILQKRIDLKPRRDTSYTEDFVEFEVQVSGDTILRVSTYIEYFERTAHSYIKERFVGIGTISYHYLSVDGPEYRDEIIDRLLYFYNGTDTLYKASDEALYIGSSANRTPLAPASEALKNQQTLAPPNSDLDGEMQ